MMRQALPIDPRTDKPAVTSADKFAGWHTICGNDKSPYMTRIWFGRLRLHIFHRGDSDPDPHDHPWSFWTFPLTPYVEEVTIPMLTDLLDIANLETFHHKWDENSFRKLQIVPAFWPSFRPATHTHRVFGRFDTSAENFNWDIGPASAIPITRPGKIVTLVWRSKESRRWGFLKHRDGRWCWMHWKEYVLNGGKDAACS